MRKHLQSALVTNDPDLLLVQLTFVWSRVLLSIILIDINNITVIIKHMCSVWQEHKHHKGYSMIILREWGKAQQDVQGEEEVKRKKK